MSKIKEKKLNSIKSEMEEIKKYVTSTDMSDIFKENDTAFTENNIDDTLTLTKIVKDKNKILNYNDLDELKKELIELKSAIDDNRDLLKEILLKIK